MPLLGAMSNNGKGRNPFSDATGGTITTFTSTGQAGTVTGGLYRVHTFSSGGTFTVTKNTGTFDYIVVGGGGTGNPGGGCGGANGGGGGGGQTVSVSGATMAVGSYTASIGGAQTTSSFNGSTALAGGYGTNSWYNTNGSYCAPGYEGTSYGPTTSDIDGTSTSYGQGHGSGYTPGPPSGYGGGGGGGNTSSAGGTVPAYSGNAGVVIVRYRIG